MTHYSDETFLEVEENESSRYPKRIDEQREEETDERIESIS